jgi:hypothetical protein
MGFKAPASFAGRADKSFGGESRHASRLSEIQISRLPIKLSSRPERRYLLFSGPVFVMFSLTQAPVPRRTSVDESKLKKPSIATGRRSFLIAIAIFHQHRGEANQIVADRGCSG